jgi:magnesium-transporting ATPase (P-type)
VKYDRLYNNSISLQYNSDKKCFEEIHWKEISIGKIIKVMKNEVIPADVLVVKSSAENGFCYLQTTNLDGESALKPREAMIIFQDLVKDENDLIKLKGSHLVVDPPDNNIYKVEGCLYLKNYEKSYFDINNILLRGGTLKNVDYIYGIVIYTGRETKIMKNIQNGSIKLSCIDFLLNKIIVYIIIMAFLICIICTTFGVLYYTENQKTKSYIFYQNSSDNKVALEVFKTFASFFTIFNTLIPISVMITLEVVKGIQVVVMQSDPLLKEQPDEKAKMLSMKLHEDLGNVKYIFTDKTGTLTRNEMEFKACSIFSKLYDEEKGEGEDISESERTEADGNNQSEKAVGQNKNKSIFSTKFDTRYLRESLMFDQPIDIVDLGNTPFLSMKDAALEFFLNIALNHNVLTEIDSTTGEKVYTGSNPDEVVLVQAAKELGIEFIERSNKFIRVNVFDKEYTFTILHRFEYSSARMRSSIVVKDKYDVIKLYMKGADSIILKKVDTYSQSFLFDRTKSHLENFAKEGLRTLCFSMKILDEVTLRDWEVKYRKIQEKAILDKSLYPEVESIISNLEDEMLLVGVSGLEDKLQEEVKPCLQDFIEAGINVWMLTGDKLDTAESIGYSCKLFNDDTEVFKIKGGDDADNTLRRVRDILDKMQTIEKELLDFKIEKRKKKKRGEKIHKPHKAQTLFIQPQKNLISSQVERIDNNLNINNQIYNNSNNNNNANYSAVGNRARINSFNIGKPQPHTQGHFQFNNGPQTDSHEGHRMLEKADKVIRRCDSMFKETDNILVRPISGQVFNEHGNAININQMNSQIINENMKFIGSNLNRKSNLITLNFVRPSHTETPLMSPKNTRARPMSSNLIKLKHNTANIYPLVKNNQKHAPSIIDSSNGEDSHEIDDVDIIKFMVDKNFFEENINKGKSNLTFLSNIMNNSNSNKKPSLKFNKGNVNTNLNLNKNVIELLPRANHDKVEGEYYNIYANQDNEEGVSSPNRKNRVFQFNLEGGHNNSYDMNKYLNNEVDENSSKLLIPSNNDQKERIDFNFIYEHYKNQIKILGPQKNPFNFNFINKDDENRDKEISMKNFGLIIEGSAITQCLNEDIAPLFWECLTKSRSVICCRCAPIQKSQVVSFVKSQSGQVTLAIGDGGNDVNMIKAANVGVGIFGKEGYQAAFNSDYAISQFKYLRRLLFVHGRFSLLRNAYFVMFFFYKNLIYTLPQFWYSFFNGFSGSLFWDDWYYLGYNSFFTTFPAAVRMLLEEDIDITFEDYPDKHMIDE